MRQGRSKEGRRDTRISLSYFPSFQSAEKLPCSTTLYSLPDNYPGVGFGTRTLKRPRGGVVTHGLQKPCYQFQLGRATLEISKPRIGSPPPPEKAPTSGIQCALACAETGGKSRVDRVGIITSAKLSALS